MEDVENFDEIYTQIESSLLELKNNPSRQRETIDLPRRCGRQCIPNIMTSNRCNSSMKSEDCCCDFNRPGKTVIEDYLGHGGEYYPAEMNEYNMIKRTLQNRNFPGS